MPYTAALPSAKARVPGRISVIIPAKDQAPFIQDCLASLQRQVDDPGRLEVLVIDDGSTDGTGQLVERFRGRLPDLRIIRNESPHGLATARNQGLQASTAEHIAFLDSDDWLAPGHLDACSRSLVDLDVDFVRTDHIRVTGGTRVLHRAPQARRNVALDPRGSILPSTESTMVDYPYAWAGMFQRRVANRGLLGFPDGLHTAEDRAWIWRLHLECDSFAVINTPGILYRRGVATSLTQIFDRRQLDFVPAFQLAFEALSKDAQAEVFWPKMIRQFLAICAHHLSRRSSMTPAVTAELADVIRLGLTDLPEHALQKELAGLDNRRRRALLPLLPKTSYLRSNA
jgi:glycosyltransferase involved in cell wall biosynthesis